MQDHEVSMAQAQLDAAKKNITKLQKKLGRKEKNIPAWVQAKITDTDHNMNAAVNHESRKTFGQFVAEGNPTARMIHKSKTQVTGHISADRGDDENKNRKGRKALEKDLRKHGIGHKKGVGEYKYSSGEGTGREVSYQTSKPDSMSKRRFGKVMRRLGRKHGQESVITKDANKPAKLHYTEKGSKSSSDSIGHSKAGKHPEGYGETSGTKVRSGKLPQKTNKPAYHYNSYDVETANKLWLEVGERLEKLGEMDGAKFKVTGEKLEEGLDMKTFKANRRKAQRAAAAADARKRGHEGSEWHNTGRTYSPDEAKSRRANMSDDDRAARKRAAIDPDDDRDENTYSADRTRNPKKKRKQDAMGEDVLSFSEFIREYKTAAWQRKEGKNPKGGLNEKGRKAYEAENPGSDLKAPQPEGGPRKKSFCARMGGMPGPMKDENGEPTRKALALRKWKC